MSGKQSLKAHEALAIQSGVAGHDYLTGATTYTFSTDSFAASASGHWFSIISTEGDEVITTTCAIGDGATSITLLQGCAYFAPVTAFTCASSASKFLCYPA